MTCSVLLPRMRNLALEPGYEQTVMQCAMEMLRWCALIYSPDSEQTRWISSATNSACVSQAHAAHGSSCDTPVVGCRWCDSEYAYPSRGICRLGWGSKTVVCSQLIILVRIRCKCKMDDVDY